MKKNVETYLMIIMHIYIYVCECMCVCVYVLVCVCSCVCVEFVIVCVCLCEDQNISSSEIECLIHFRSFSFRSITNAKKKQSHFKTLSSFSKLIL